MGNSETHFNMINSILDLRFSYSLLIILALLIIAFTLLIFYIKSKKELKQLEFRSATLDSLLNVLQPCGKIDKSLDGFLLEISTIIKASCYAIYFYNEKDNNFCLRSVRQLVDDNPDITPSYSSLMPYKKENFLIPAVLPKDIIPKRTSIRKEGEVSFIVIPFKGERTIVTMSSINSLSKKEFILLDYLAEKIQPMIDAIIENEKLRKQVSVSLALNKTNQRISNMFSDFSGMLSVVMNISLKTVNASGGMFIMQEKGSFSIELIMGVEEEIEILIKEDKHMLKLLSEFIGDEKFIKIKKNDNRFYKIPPYLIAEGIEFLLLLNVKSNNKRGIAVFWFDEIRDFREYQTTGLEILSRRMGDIISTHNSVRELSISYIEILKMLSRLIDNMKPSTVGYSELMFKYAAIISKELGLSSSDINDISLAAYFSNIGIIGLSDEILFKKGYYTDAEYNVMKLHTDVGASIIEITIGNQVIADCIRYHHERIDGNGYPYKINGEQIPLGARIIAVVQTFLAKIISRDYRPALAFEDAIKQLVTASGTQLDFDVVMALVNWFKRKQNINLHINRALENCWEMRCSPESICIDCPAYKNTIKNCWEMSGNKCATHGNSCDTCFIFTECLYRMRRRP